MTWSDAAWLAVFLAGAVLVRASQERAAGWVVGSEVPPSRDVAVNVGPKGGRL